MSRAYLLLLDQRPCISCSPGTGCPADTVHVLSHIEWGIITDNMGYVADIDTSRDQVGTHETKVYVVSRIVSSLHTCVAYMCISWDLNFSNIVLRSLAPKSLEYARTTIPRSLSLSPVVSRMLSKNSKRRTNLEVDSADFVKTKAFLTPCACSRCNSISGFCDDSQTIICSYYEASVWRPQ